MDTIWIYFAYTLSYNWCHRGGFIGNSALMDVVLISVLVNIIGSFNYLIGYFVCLPLMIVGPIIGIMILVKKFK